MRRLLNRAANAAVKTKRSIFEMVYQRLLPRLGHAQRSHCPLTTELAGQPRAGELPVAHDALW